MKNPFKSIRKKTKSPKKNIQRTQKQLKREEKQNCQNIYEKNLTAFTI